VKLRASQPCVEICLRTVLPRRQTFHFYVCTANSRQLYFLIWLRMILTPSSWRAGVSKEGAWRSMEKFCRSYVRICSFRHIVVAKSFLKTRRSKHQIFVKDLLHPYKGVSSKCCVPKGSQQHTDIVNRLTALNNLNCCVVTSAEEGGYVFGAVCLSVCLSVRRITRKLVNGF